MPDLQAEWARLLVASFADAGVGDVVISPGSRSTPFVLAAARHPSLRAWDLIDERSAAFFALGQARVTGRPALLICTSGTAAANYLPAVVEAGAAHVPLLVLTADRPIELADCGANQTIDQLKLYGGHARAFVDFGAPQGSTRALRALRRAVAQAVHRSLDPEPGAVHLNARAAKPLEPAEDRAPDDRLAAEVDALLARPIVQPCAPRRLPAVGEIEELAACCQNRLAAEVDALLARPIVQPCAPRRLPAVGEIEELAACCQSERGLVVCGPAPIAQRCVRPLLARLGALTGFPVYCEPASQGRFGDRGERALFVDPLDALLHSPAFRRTMAPELVLQIGRCPTSGVWGRYLAEHASCEHRVIAPHGWHDSQSTATRLIRADVAPALERLLAELEGGGNRPSETAWATSFRRASELAGRVIEESLGDDVLSEGAVAREVAEALPSGALLALGNSLPIRVADTWCRGGGDLAVWSQRGASGIDGVTSGAAGAATRWDGPAALLIGDVSFLHDLSGLAAARRVDDPFVIVVVQNRGGRIFEQLPLASHPTARNGVFDHWLTPHDLDFSHAAALYRLPYARVESREALAVALKRGLEGPGATVVEAVVPPGDAAERSRRVWQRIEEELAAAGIGSSRD